MPPFVVAASGASTESKYGIPDRFRCDGTADEVQIDAANDALPAGGGKVTLTEGTFELSTAPSLDQYTILEGQGVEVTILHGDGTFDLLTLANNVTVRNLSLITGTAATGESGSDHALVADGVTGVVFENVTVRRRGQDVATKYPLQAQGTIDETTKFLDCDFINEVTDTGTTASTRGACIGVNPDSATSPKFRDCRFIGGAGTGANPHGLTVQGASESKFYNCTMTGGTAGTEAHGMQTGGTCRPKFWDCHFLGGDVAATGIMGVLVGDASAPEFFSGLIEASKNAGATTPHGLFTEYGSMAILNGCIIHSGRVDNTSCVYPSLGSAPVLESCILMPEPRCFAWDYDDLNNGRFRPFAAPGYNLMALSINVSTANVGETLDIGTAASGTQVASAIDIGTVGNFKVAAARVGVAAAGYLYATPSAPISDGDVTLFYTVISAPGVAGRPLICNTEGHARFHACTVMAPNEAAPVQINDPACATANWRIDNCLLEAVNTDQRSVNLQTAANDILLAYNAHVGSAAYGPLGNVLNRIISAAQGNEGILEGWVTHGTQNPTLGTLPAHAMVTDVLVWVQEAFNDSGTDLLTVGYDADVDAYGTSLDVSSTGVKAMTLGATSKTVDATSRSVEAYYTDQNADASAGEAHVLLKYTICTVNPA